MFNFLIRSIWFRKAATSDPGLVFHEGRIRSILTRIRNPAVLTDNSFQSWNSRPDEQQGVKPGFDAEPGHDNYIEGPDARPPVRDNADVESVKKLVVKDTILQYPVGEEEEKSRFL